MKTKDTTSLEATYVSSDVLLLREDDLVRLEFLREGSGESGDLGVVGGESSPARERRKSARRVVSLEFG